MLKMKRKEEEKKEKMEVQESDYVSEWYTVFTQTLG
jgi:hypothetical protein